MSLFTINFEIYREKSEKLIYDAYLDHKRYTAAYALIFSNAHPWSKITHRVTVYVHFSHSGVLPSN